MFYDQQIEALDKARQYVREMRFRAPKLNSFGIKVWQTGFLITIEAIIQIHLFLKNQFDEPYLLPYFCSQDELEQFFSKIRGLGGGFNLHPSPLEFYQRLGQLLFITHTMINFSKGQRVFEGCILVHQDFILPVLLDFHSYIWFI